MVRTTGSKSFTQEETNILLDLVEKMRPLLRDRWEEVAVAYNDLIAGKDLMPRDCDALKRRFMVLAYAKKPASEGILGEKRANQLAIEEWTDAIERAMIIHQSILEEAGATVVNIPMEGGGLVGSPEESIGHHHHHHHHHLLLNGEEADLVSANLPSYPNEDDYVVRYPAGYSLTTITPVRTGKRGRPPGSTTGAAARRMAMQTEHIANLNHTVLQMQKQLREVREALATVVETQTNQSALLAVLQQHLHQSPDHVAFSSIMPLSQSTQRKSGNKNDANAEELIIKEDAFASDDDQDCHDDVRHHEETYQKLLA